MCFQPETVSSPSDLVMLCSYELDHLDTASLTLLGRRHRVLKIFKLLYFQFKTGKNHLGVSPVPGVMAPRIVPGVTLKTVNRVAS